MVVGHVDSLSTKCVALMSTGYVRDTVVNTESQLTTIVHQGSDCQVCQCKQCATLTHISPIQVFIRHRHHRNSVMFVNLSNLTAGIGSKAVCSIQQFLNIHSLHIINLAAKIQLLFGKRKNYPRKEQRKYYSGKRKSLNYSRIKEKRCTFVDEMRMQRTKTNTNDYEKDKEDDAGCHAFDRMLYQRSSAGAERRWPEKHDKD
jgi:hypothetical protein